MATDFHRGFPCHAIQDACSGRTQTGAQVTGYSFALLSQAVSQVQHDVNRSRINRTLRLKSDRTDPNNEALTLHHIAYGEGSSS